MAGKYVLKNSITGKVSSSMMAEKDKIIGQMYSSAATMENGIASVSADAAGAVEDSTQ